MAGGDGVLARASGFVIVEGLGLPGSGGPALGGLGPLSVRSPPTWRVSLGQATCARAWRSWQV